MRKTISLLTFIIVITIIITIYVLFFRETYSPLQMRQLPSPSPSPYPSMQPNKYQQIIFVNDFESLQKNFLIDNPLEDGTDPTDGEVDYSYAMAKDKFGVPILNVNGNASWQEIPSEGKIKDLVTNYVDEMGSGIKIKLSDNLVSAGLKPDIFQNICFAANKVGTVRLSSRKLFKGGLFVFDVAHIPIGCTIWPAIWLNGFVGLPDQYHEQEGTTLFNESMEKLYKSTIQCGSRDKALDPFQSLDMYMSRFAGKPVYVAQWPMGGEFDIVEQTNFSKTNLMSIHGGPNCEVRAEFESNYLDPFISPQHEKANFRSTCGITMDRNAPYNHFSGCKKPEYKVDSITSDQANMFDLSKRSCPNAAGDHSGNTQIVGPIGSYGEPFNKTGGGVFAVQWIPKERVFIWFYPRTDYSLQDLQVNGMPLSNNPNPNIWKNNDNGKRILVMSYKLDANDALTSGCDFNFQSIIMNITVGGGWGGAATPDYCRSDVKNCDPRVVTENFGQFRSVTMPKPPIVKPTTVDKKVCGDGGGDHNIKFINKCFTAKPSDANSIGVANGCYDGAYNENARGVDAKPVFFTEAYFKIRSIAVFQKDGDDNVW